MQFLAVLRRRTEQFSGEQFEPLLEPEAQAVRRLYIEGKIRSIWSRGDTPGGAMLLEADSPDEARATLESFPLVQAGMMDVQSVIPLRGYRGFAPRD